MDSYRYSLKPIENGQNRVNSFSLFLFIQEIPVLVGKGAINLGKSLPLFICDWQIV